MKRILLLLTMLLCIVTNVHAQPITNICQSIGKYIYVRYADTYRTSLCGTPGNGPCNVRKSYCGANATITGPLGNGATCVEPAFIAYFGNQGSNAVGTCNTIGNRYSWECASYQRCMLSTNGANGMCQDLIDAVDTIAVAPHCADVSGNWVDQGTEWLVLTHDKTAQYGNEIVGQAYLNVVIGGVKKDCGIGEVTGTQNSTTGEVTLTIDNDPDATYCSDISTLKLKPDGLGNLDGYWVNASGGVGGYLYFDKKLNVQ